jgi:hypothetical protein
VSRPWIAPALISAAVAVPLAVVAPAAAAPAPTGSAPTVVPGVRVLDREVRACTRSSTIIGVLERDRPRLEVDAEIIGPRRATWTFTIRHNGQLVQTVTKRADSDGEVDVWRYLRDRPGQDRVVVTARSAGGERCVMTLRG